MERSLGVEWRTLIFEARAGRAAEPLPQRLDQSRLTDPGLADKQDHLAPAARGRGPCFAQDSQLVLASDQLCKARSTPRAKTALGRSAGDGGIGADRGS